MKAAFLLVFLFVSQPLPACTVNLFSITGIRIGARTNEARLWAFVSVTNNDTQHVTTVTPQHRRR